MKKILLSVFTCLFVSAAIAQGSLKLIDIANNDVTNTDVYTWGPNNMDITYDAYVINMSSATKTIKAKRIETNVPSGSTNYFCWHLCYSPIVSNSPQGLAIAPADTNRNFHGYYNGGGMNGESIVTYVFYDQNNTNDSSYVRVHFYASPTGIQEAVTGENKLTAAYPNPASSIASLNYSLKSNVQSAKIVMYDMIGAMVKEITLDDKQGTVKLNVGDIPTGIYFYSLVADNKVINTRKLIVSH